jgi:hypothetical protein
MSGTSSIVGTSSIGASTVLDPSRSLVTVPRSGVFTIPCEQDLGYMQLPDGRIVETTHFPAMQSGSSEMGTLEELNELRGQLTKAQYDNQVLRLAWKTALVDMHASRARQAATQEELQEVREALQKELDTNLEYLLHIQLMQRKIESLSDKLEKSERSLEFFELLNENNSSTVHSKKKSSTAEQLSIK